MSLEDFTTEIDNESCDTFYWYYNACDDRGVMDYIDYEKDEFGMGKEYTSTMIDIWNGRVDGVNYGEQDDYDMWGVIQNKIYDKNRKISLVCTFQE